MSSYGIDFVDQAARDAEVAVRLGPEAAAAAEAVVELPAEISVFWRYTQWTKTTNPFGIVEGADVPFMFAGYYYSIFGELRNYLASDELAWVVDTVNSTLPAGDYVFDNSRRGKIFVYGFGLLASAGNALNLPIIINGTGFNVPVIQWH